jgi:hypothetical protein
MRQNLKKYMQTKQNLKNLRASNLSIASGTNHRSRSVDESLRFQQALADAPDVRAETVARGKALVADPDYPSQEQIRKVAGILAGHLSNPKTSSTRSSAKRRSLHPAMGVR